jgi:hypothetical protein
MAEKRIGKRMATPRPVWNPSGTDQLDLAAVRSVAQIIGTYQQQMEAIEAAGGRLIVMASRALARIAGSPSYYEHVYRRVLEQAREPVIIH